MNIGGTLTRLTREGTLARAHGDAYRVRMTSHERFGTSLRLTAGTFCVQKTGAHAERTAAAIINDAVVEPVRFGLAGTKIMCNDQRYGCTNSSVGHNSGNGQATERRGS